MTMNHTVCADYAHLRLTLIVGGMLLISSAHAETVEKRCAETSCKTEIRKLDDEEHSAIERIKQVDISLKETEEKQRKLKSDGSKLNSDIRTYNIECTGVIVKSAADLNAKLVECEARKQALEERQTTHSENASELPALSTKVVTLTADMKKLEASKEEAKTKRLELYSRAISYTLSLDVSARSKATKACNTTSDIEQGICCHSVVWDGRSPNQCDLPLLYITLDRAGVFSSPVVVPRK